MPRTFSFEKYEATLKVIMDNAGKGEMEYRMGEAMGVRTLRDACAKRAKVYAMMSALNKSVIAETDEGLKKNFRVRLASWNNVSLRVVELGEEKSANLRDGSADARGELLFINKNLTRESIDLMADIEKQLAEQKAKRVPVVNPVKIVMERRGIEVAPAVEVDITQEFMQGGMDIAGMLERTQAELEAEAGQGEAEVIRVLEVDPVTGYQKMSDGRVLNRYGIFMAWQEGYEA